MEKAKPAVLRQLKENYEKACNAWVAELKRMWGISSPYGYWIGDEVGGVYDFDGACTLGLQEIIYAVSNNISHEQAAYWMEYVCWAVEFDFRQPTLREYVEGRIPVLDNAARKRISNMKADLERACREERDRLKTMD